jgi:hypothetical protein
MPPQPSGSVPQFFPPVHRDPIVPGVQPQTLGTLGVAPPQVLGAVHAGPQLITVPHLLVSVPQLSGPGHVVKSGVQPHTSDVPGLPPPQVAGAVHVPQLTIPPQPSETGAPQFLPSQRMDLGIELQHTFGEVVSPCAGLPPQVAGAVHVPQLMTVWQLLVSVPQLAGAGHVVKLGMQPQTLPVHI